jgi:hypothetical protein
MAVLGRQQQRIVGQAQVLRLHAPCVARAPEAPSAFHSSAHAAYPTRHACTSQSQQGQPLARSRPCRVDPSRFRRDVQARHWPGGLPHHSRLRSFLRRCQCKLGPRRRAPPRLHGLLRRAVLSLAVHRSRSRRSLWSGWRCTARCRTFIRRLRGMSRTRCAARFPS